MKIESAYLAFEPPEGKYAEDYGMAITNNTDSWWVVICACNRMIVKYDSIEEMKAICQIADEVGLKYLACFKSLSDAMCE